MVVGVLYWDSHVVVFALAKKDGIYVEGGRLTQ